MARLTFDSLNCGPAARIHCPSKRGGGEKDDPGLLLGYTHTQRRVVVVGHDVVGSRRSCAQCERGSLVRCWLSICDHVRVGVGDE